MARKTVKSKTVQEPLDITSAKQADGALPSIRSVYDLVGVRTASYREKSYETYQATLRKMNLSELHDHAYAVAVVPAATKELMIDRLERKYLQENPDQREKYYKTQTEGKKDNEEMTIEERAKAFMSRAR